MDDNLEKHSEESLSCGSDVKMLQNNADFPESKVNELDIDEKDRQSTMHGKMEANDDDRSCDATASKEETISGLTDETPTTDKKMDYNTESTSTIVKDGVPSKVSNTVENKDDSSSKESKHVIDENKEITMKNTRHPEQVITDQEASGEPHKFAPERDANPSNNHVLPDGPKEWDAISGLSMCHLSFVLDHFLPTWHPTVNNTFWDYQKDKLLQMYKATYALNGQTDIELCGGLINGLYVPPFHEKSDDGSPDFDKLTNDLIKSHLQVMVIAKEKQVLQTDQDNFEHLELYPFFALNNDCHGGFLKVQSIDETTWNQCTIEKDGQKYLSSELVKQSFASGQLFNQDDKKDMKSECTENEDIMLNQNQVQVALPCPAWPKQAEEWEARDRPSGWPSKESRKVILQTKCLIQPACHPKSQWKEVEWAYDFSTAEIMLANTLTLTQRKCYMLLHVMVECYLQVSQSEITTILKAISFRSMEKIPADHWQDETIALARCFFFMLDELYQCLKNHNISHYFLSDNNTIDHIDTKVLANLQQTVLEIRQEPLKYVFAFDRKKKFPFSIKQDYEHVLGSVLEVIAVQKPNMRETERERLLTLEHLVDKYFQEGYPLGAVEVAEELAAIYQSYLNEKLNIMNFLQSKIVNRISPDIAADAYEYILKRYENLGEFPFMLCHMACQYTVLYCRESEGVKKETLRQKTNETHKRACNAEKNIEGPIMLEYCVFLIACHRHEEAIPYLLRIIEIETEKTHLEKNMFGAYERCVVDANLQREIDAVGKVAQPCLLLAYYLLVHCYVIFHWKDEAHKIMDIYGTYTEGVFHTLKDAQAWSLLGYAYMELKDHYKAFGAFMKALEAEPGYNLARENMKHCTAQYRLKLGLGN